MSGILGLFNVDQRPVNRGELSDMASLLTRRGPDRTGIWHSGSIGLGHTLLVTTPEMLLENLPLEHSQSGCIITGDIRLDNREELLERLHLGDRKDATGDAGLALAAYLEWGDACAQHLLGDFAFAVWDPNHERLFCARDHMGMRQLTYHHSPGRFFAFATEPRAILVLPQVPYRVNEERIADYLVEELEGIDKTSTFFEEVYRLPPAHTLTITHEGMRQRRYAELDTGAELRLGSPDAYAEAFLEVFTRAVHCRLRAVGSVGSMLSGGVDSGSIVAVARRLLAAENRGPLLTFSAISPDGDAEPETRAIRAALTMDGLAPTTVSYGHLDDLLPDLVQLTREEDEPFDRNMTLLRVVYLSARRRGLKMLLDGAGGDTVLTEGRRIPRLLRAGRWGTAYREAAGQNRFWNGALPPHRELLRSARAAFVPNLLLRPPRRWRQRARIGRTLRSSPIDARFRQRIVVAERLRMLEGHSAPCPLSDAHHERARAVYHPYLTVARERYDRVAGAIGIEPRDPFLDVRVLSFLVGLPDDQLLVAGWPKAILRRATAGLLPDVVRWRRGKEHLGWAFTAALIEQTQHAALPSFEAGVASLRPYIDAGAVHDLSSRVESGSAREVSEAYHLSALALWLQSHQRRPVVSNGRK